MNDTSGAVITIAGNGNAGLVNGAGSTAEFNYPRGVAAYKDGRVYVIDHNNNCIRLIIPSPSGLNDLNHNSSVSIFPNPFSLETTVQIDHFFQNANMTLYNSNGQQVKQIRNVTGQKFTLQRDNLAPGHYFLRLSQGSQTFITKPLLSRSSKSPKLSYQFNTPLNEVSEFGSCKHILRQ